MRLRGMTCASCAARIEKKLNRLEGVQASVNFATETAAVRYDPDTVTPEDLLATGYTATLPAPERTGAEAPAEDRDEAARRVESDQLRQRVLTCAALTVPVVLMSAVSPTAVPVLAVAVADAAMLTGESVPVRRPLEWRAPPAGRPRSRSPRPPRRPGPPPRAAMAGQRSGPGPNCRTSGHCPQ
jgi:cation transport ATPase